MPYSHPITYLRIPFHISTIQDICLKIYELLLSKSYCYLNRDYISRKKYLILFIGFSDVGLSGHSDTPAFNCLAAQLPGAGPTLQSTSTTPQIQVRLRVAVLGKNRDSLPPPVLQEGQEC